MANILTWTLALINLAPIFWMIWCSFLSNNEILQGKILPTPKSNDIAFIHPHKEDTLVVGTINGEVYLQLDVGEGSLEQIGYTNFGLHAAAYLPQGDSLWIMSANKGLQVIQKGSLEPLQQWSWSYFEQQYLQDDHSSFLQKPNYLSEHDYIAFAKLLNTAWVMPELPPLGEQTQIQFMPNIGVLKQLNTLLQTDTLRRKVVQTLLPIRHWEQPIIRYLSHQKKISPSQEKILLRFLLAELYPHQLTQFEMTDWVDIWTDRIPDDGHGLSITQVGSKIYFAMWWDEFPGIGIFDIHTQQTDWITVRHGLPESSIQHLLAVGGANVLAVSDLGLSIIDTEHGTVLRNYLFGDHGLPFFDGRQVQALVLDSSKVVLSYGQELLLFDMDTQQAMRLNNDFMHDLASDISALQLGGQNLVLVGTGEGLFRVPLDRWLRVSEQQSNGFYPERIEDLFQLDRAEDGLIVLSNSLIRVINAVEDRIYLGGIFGRLSVLEGFVNELRLTQNLPEGPYKLNWRNYEDLWRTIPFGKFLKNSLIICLTVMVISMLVSSFSGYALARYNFPGKELFGYSVLSTQMIPAILYLIPIFVFYTLFYDVTGLRLVNTYTGIIFTYSAFFIPMSIWILRGFFSTIPKELEEAALIDGCTPLTAFFKVILPSAWPGVMATGIYVFLLAWDELMFAWVLSTDIQTATIPVGIRLYVGQFGNRFDLLMAASTVATLPAMVLFFIMQKQIVSGLTQGAVKE